jgi:predicted MFS family arabinose efflux permease
MVGSFLGAVGAPRLRARIVEERMLLGALVTIAAAAVVAGRVGGRPGAAVLAFVVGFAANAGKLGFDSLVQRDAPDAAQGRAFARFESQFQLAWVAGALLPVAVRVPQNVGFFVLAIGLALAAMTYATGRRTLRGRSTSTNTGAAKSPFGD